ncbi:glutamate-5-semialdehyde dehydrogenase [Phakopsora pachyrhizi]|uniref:glutamate-5-semialdehyde dehydrogenase n=1 Tax=Phakopsora pachyrhizi TaxID=170000 RepID=A0AAV0BMY6_PHAPC|nr:glutamate-5-semialdehyde dehydrogenase [Phakopsora pachyrhizi]CAH7687549.1 glutamate-5-semialdehyde dehydrogenase [Phakopsora pachyrhizi]
MASSSSSSIASDSKNAFDEFQSIPKELKQEALRRLKSNLTQRKHEIMEANSSDLRLAREQQIDNSEGSINESLLKRLDLNSSPDKFDSMVEGLDDVIGMEDPIEKVLSITRLDDDLDLIKVTCPIGVLLIIFEARPEVMINITGLAIKSGNAAILKSGKESINTQAVLTQIIDQSLDGLLPRKLIQTVCSRAEIDELLSEDGFIDLVIPRGSKQLVQHVKSRTNIPVLGHSDGLCTIYLDESADPIKTSRCVIDSKITYPAACNSVETLLIHRSLLESDRFASLALDLLNSKVTLKLDRASLDSLKNSSLVKDHPLFWTNCSLSKTDEDYRTEWLGLTVSIRTVDSLNEAIEHINRYSSHHTDSIITESQSNGQLFCRAVNSSSVYVNCSTRFADGFRYGFGTEVGISTSKIHARGPVGLDGLVIYKWIMSGGGPRGHITSEFGGPSGKKFIHQKIL